MSEVDEYGNFYDALTNKYTCLSHSDDPETNARIDEILFPEPPPEYRQATREELDEFLRKAGFKGLDDFLD